MSLNYDKLLRFDLLNDADQKFNDDREKCLEFLKLCYDIGATDRFIRECPSFPGSTKSIIRDELVSVIGSTLSIEGIVLREEEIKEALQDPSLGNIHAVNSRKVYDYIHEEIRQSKGNFVYKEEYITKIHELFTAGIDYIGSKPGVYRDINASFGEPRRVSLCHNYADIYQAMKNYIEWLNSRKTGWLTSNTFANAIMAHYYLAEIHPFGDGNGRTARAIEAIVLYADRINPYCFWSLANFWGAHRNEYITHLGEIRDTCDPLDFIIWGAKGYLEEVNRIKDRILKKLKCLMLRDYMDWLYKNKKRQKPEKKINQRIRDVIFLLTDFGKITFDQFRNSPQYGSLYSGISSSSKSRDLTKMKSLDLIRISTVEGTEFIEPNYDILEKMEYVIP